MLEVVREPATLEVGFTLTTELPADTTAALSSGAEVRLSYPIRVKAKRRGWWDRKIWSGELVTLSVFDPVTGRFRCQVVLDGVITSTSEVESVAAARQCLTGPPAVHIELPEERRNATLKVRVRAVISSGTTWLLIPTQDATPWVEAVLDQATEPTDTGE